MTTRHGRARTVTVALVAAASATLLTSCGVPIPAEVPDTSAPSVGGADPVDRLVPDDERAAELVAALRVLSARVEEARDLLAARDAAAVGVLLGAPGGGDAPGVLPAIEPDRAGLGSDDLVTGTITLAGDVGGERSRIVLELARDPMLGDLGAWQRDPVGVITLLRAIADTPGDAEALDAALLEVPGELARALGYAFVVAGTAGTEDPALAAHAAAQGAGRLGVVLVALDLAVERLEAIATETAGVTNATGAGDR